jgi:PadR family transcriptional regulator, regulatory protein AphA
MPRTSLSRFALLGLLSIKPMSGYDLKQLSARSIEHFWREGYGQIYPTLKQMAAKGLVSRETKTNPGRPDRHIYALTPAGRRELIGWLAKPPVQDVPRSEFLLKLFFGGLAAVSITRKHLAEHRAACEIALRTYRATRIQVEKEARTHPQKPFWEMTLDYGEHLTQAKIKWCDKILRTLAERKKAAKT